MMASISRWVCGQAQMHIVSPEEKKLKWGSKFQKVVFAKMVLLLSILAELKLLINCEKLFQLQVSSLMFLFSNVHTLKCIFWQHSKVYRNNNRKFFDVQNSTKTAFLEWKVTNREFLLLKRLRNIWEILLVAKKNGTCIKTRYSSPCIEIRYNSTCINFRHSTPCI